VSWVHQDPFAKSKRVTNSSGNVVSIVELDPWGGDTTRSSNSGFQPRLFTTYDRDGNQSDEAMHRRYNRWHARFDQPDPYGGSYNLTNPQSFNRYSYVQNDPVNFVDPLGLDPDDPIDPATGKPTPVAGPTASVDIPIGGGGDPSGIIGDTGIVIVDGGEPEPGGGGGSTQTPTPTPTTQQNPYPGCITANWFVNLAEVKAIFADYRKRTQGSGNENGGWFFYEPKTNKIIGKTASEGGASSMPKEPAEFEAQMAEFKKKDNLSFLCLTSILTHVNQ
jgi:RHS repeat-associated protein